MRVNETEALVQVQVVLPIITACCQSRPTERNMAKCGIYLVHMITLHESLVS